MDKAKLIIHTVKRMETFMDLYHLTKNIWFKVDMRGEDPYAN